MSAPRAKALPRIDPARCTGCGWCVAVCGPHVLSLQVLGDGRWGPKRSQLDDAGGCTGCALCGARLMQSAWCGSRAVRAQMEHRGQARGEEC